MNYYKTWKILGLIGLLLILFMSLKPQQDGPVWIEHLDKFLHFSTYSIASFYYHQLYKNNNSLKLSFGLLIYSAMIEILQYFSRTRSAEFADLVANLSGILLGQWISWKCPNVLVGMDNKIKNLK